MKEQGKQTKKKRLILRKPNKFGWPACAREDDIISFLTRHFEEIKKSHPNSKLAWDSKRRRQATEQVTSISNKIVIGANQVLRHLENDSLQLCLVWSQLQPSFLLDLIGVECVVHKCPAVALNKLNETMSPILNVKRVSVLAIKKSMEQNGHRDEIVDYVISKSPSLSTPQTTSFMNSLPPEFANRHIKGQLVTDSSTVSVVDTSESVIAATPGPTQTIDQPQPDIETKSGTSYPYLLPDVLVQNVTRQKVKKKKRKRKAAAEPDQTYFKCTSVKT